MHNTRTKQTKKQWGGNCFADKKKHTIQNATVSQKITTKLCGCNRFHCHLQTNMLAVTWMLSSINIQTFFFNTRMHSIYIQ